ncbi:MAG: hypothetical protein M1833_006564 [Piccolia ochrophora]|nr:MAG: hypothetical protein M1833_006564 [Piccolia ochrophora]
MSAALVSPTMYSGPPPPYSYPATMASATPALTGLVSPPESRRTSGDDKEPQPHRQSLPSISEALGREQPLGHALPTPTSAASHHSHFVQPHSPSTPIPRSHPPEQTRASHTQPPSIYNTPNQHPSKLHQQSAPAQPEPRRISLPSVLPHDPKLPSLHAIRSVQSPTLSSRPEQEPVKPPLASPRYEQGPRSADSMTSSFSHGNYQSQYPYPHQHSAPAPPVYQAPPNYSVHGSYPNRFDGSEVGRVQEAQQVFKGFKGVNGEKYGASVKRHLDYFDLEASLNEIADSSGRLNDFSREYKNRTRDIPSTGFVPGSLPTLAECDEMIRHEGRIQDLLTRLRELLVSQQHALASQRAQERRFKASSDYEMEDSSPYQDDAKNAGLLGSEAKKRRGRAAPPGRCHSCNRAETPEWRRGPDGARTLCNACGLHYAKLTRKMGSKATVAGSSLRPKSLAPGSPQQ